MYAILFTGFARNTNKILANSAIALRVVYVRMSNANNKLSPEYQ